MRESRITKEEDNTEEEEEKGGRKDEEGIKKEKIKGKRVGLIFEMIQRKPSRRNSSKSL